MTYDDKTILTDMLQSQKFLASNYNNYAGECSTKAGKAKLMKILGDVHDTQFKIFEQMQAKGWYETPKAPTDKVNEAVQTHIKCATDVTQNAKTRAKNQVKAKAAGAKSAAKTNKK